MKMIGLRMVILMTSDISINYFVTLCILLILDFLILAKVGYWMNLIADRSMLQLFEFESND